MRQQFAPLLHCDEAVQIDPAPPPSGRPVSGTLVPLSGVVAMQLEPDWVLQSPNVQQ
jgi:hypothetical protein